MARYRQITYRRNKAPHAARYVLGNLRAGRQRPETRRYVHPITPLRINVEAAAVIVPSCVVRLLDSATVPLQKSTASMPKTVS